MEALIAEPNQSIIYQILFVNVYSSELWVNTWNSFQVKEFKMWRAWILIFIFFMNMMTMNQKFELFASIISP